MEKRHLASQAKIVWLSTGSCWRFWLLAILLSTGSAFGSAQDESSIRSIIESRDIKKLRRADQIRADADRHTEITEKLKNEIRVLHHDSTLNKRRIKRKVRLIESQSWQKELQASVLYGKSNDLKYNVYKQYLNRFWKDHEGEESKFIDAKVLEEQARDNYSQATFYRRHTKHMNLGSSKIEKLTEANNLESVAIRRQVTSLATCYGFSGNRALAAVADSTAKQAYAEDTSRIPVVTEKEFEPEMIVEDKPATIVPEIPQPIPLEPEISAPLPVTGEKPAREEIPEKKDDTMNPVIFRVQVAASRVPLTLQELARMYPGNFPVEAVSEGGWTKYQFVGVRLYSDAQRIFREAGVKDAFIVAYRNGIKQSTAEMIKENRDLEKRLQAQGNTGLPDEKEFHVELAVSRMPLKPAEVSRLYHGQEPVILIMEKGLYRYQLNAGFSFTHAESLRQQSGISGAVIVTYRNAVRMDTP